LEIKKKEKGKEKGDRQIMLFFFLNR